MTDSPAALSRRGFLRTAAGAVAAGAAVAAGSASALASPADTQRFALLRLDLGGAAWQLHGLASRPLAANVPGCTYTDLLTARKIPDPYYRENNGAVQWVAQQKWLYSRTFEAPAAALGRHHLDLVCHGLDTLATITLNKKYLAATDNMFRTWRFDVRGRVHAGSNHLAVQFDPLKQFVDRRAAQYMLQHHVALFGQRSWVRKAPYMWGWDWCRPLLTQGIWQPIMLEAYDSRIADVAVLQHHDGPRVRLDVRIKVAGDDGGSAVVSVHRQGRVVAGAKTGVQRRAAQASLLIPDAQLWWPNGLGEQPLYTVRVELLSAAGAPQDAVEHRVGLRTIQVAAPANGQAMHVVVNGVPMFAKGADWVPPDNLPTRVSPQSLRDAMRDAAACNFNFIRLWGGGYYEPDALFDACDELGLLLQFEFKFANDSYPVYEPRWMANLRQEVQQQVRRCRNHPSIAIWSGNNEIGRFKGYDFLFDKTIGGIVRALVPGAFFEPGSGATGSGDVHSWGVWHGKQPFESYRSIHGFVTEFGMQSFPSPATVDAFTAPGADRASIYSPVMAYHELGGGIKGIDLIARYMQDNFGPLPKDFNDNLYLSQVMQAWGIAYGVEHWRRDMPHSMAATIWQYNDSWPGATWSAVDYFRRWKALQYCSRRFFQPVLVSGLPDAATGHCPLHVVNDRQQAVKGILEWQATDTAGTRLAGGSTPALVPPRTSMVVKTLDLSALVRAHGPAGVLLWVRLRNDKTITSDNLLFFPRPGELKLHPPGLKCRVRGGGHRFAVTLSSAAPALWAFLDLPGQEARFSDNFLHLFPRRPATVHMTVGKPLSAAAVQRNLVLRSVYDIAPGMRAGA